MELRVDRDARAAGTRRFASPALLAPLETTVIALDGHRIDRATIATIPANRPHAIELPSIGACVLVTLVLDARTIAAATAEYAPYIAARRFSEVLATPRILPRTRWVDELVQRYVFEREVCEKPGSRAARFLEAELAKEIYFLGSEQIEQRTRTSVLHEGEPVAVRARAWIEEHLFEPFAIDALVRHLGASESTVLRAFRKELGVAPVIYLRRRRLEEARQLLETGRYAVTEVATRVGYDNPSAFAAAFRDQFGTPPSAMRPVLDPARTLPAHGKPPKRPTGSARRPASRRGSAGSRAAGGAAPASPPRGSPRRR
jgi:AraC-like DNA-binding protein